jgi:hypothetical protein
MNLVQNLSISTVVTCLGFTILNPGIGRAVVVSRTFTVSDFAQPGIGSIDNRDLSYGNSYSGVFTYNNQLSPGSDLKNIPILDLSFNFLGNTYTQRDDVSPQFPKLDIQDETNPILNFVINKPGLAANFNNSGFVFGLSPSASAGRNDTGYSVVDPNGLYTGRVRYGSATTVSVLEPSNIAGIICLALSGCFFHLKKSKNSQLNTALNMKK